MTAYTCDKCGVLCRTNDRMSFAGERKKFEKICHYCGGDLVEKIPNPRNKQGGN